MLPFLRVWPQSKWASLRSPERCFLLQLHLQSIDSNGQIGYLWLLLAQIFEWACRRPSMLSAIRYLPRYRPSLPKLMTTCCDSLDCHAGLSCPLCGALPREDSPHLPLSYALCSLQLWPFTAKQCANFRQCSDGSESGAHCLTIHQLRDEAREGTFLELPPFEQSCYCLRQDGYWTACRAWLRYSCFEGRAFALFRVKSQPAHNIAHSFKVAHSPSTLVFLKSEPLKEARSSRTSFLLLSKHAREPAWSSAALAASEQRQGPALQPCCNSGRMTLAQHRWQPCSF